MINLYIILKICKLHWKIKMKIWEFLNMVLLIGLFLLVHNNDCFIGYLD